MTQVTIAILFCSILLQLAAAFLAWRLSKRIKGVSYAWQLIAAALVLMASRRIVTFVGFFAPQVEGFVQGFLAETIALLIAVLMLWGVYLIPSVFQSLLQSTQALKVNEKFLDNILDSSPVGIAVADRTGNILKLNNRFVSWFGDILAQKKSLFDWFTEVMPNPDSQVLQPDGQDYDSEQNLPLKDLFEFKVLCQDHLERTLELSLKQSRNYLLFTFMDITERLKAEQERLKLKKLESLGLLAGGIAHDFNNLLAGLYGNVELAKMACGDQAHAEEYFESALLSMNRASHLTDQLLTFAKGGEPVKESVSLEKVIAETAEFSLHGSRVRLELEMDPDLWVLPADKGQISQVISNLVINAKQAMPQGGTLTITANNRTLSTGRWVEIRVEDEGVGIEPENLDRVFDPYFTTKPAGNGLGLASTFSIVQKHSGSIRVDSQVGKGTAFTIQLPVPEQSVTSAPSALPMQQNETLCQNKKVLLLEDEAIVHKMIKAMLEQMGCRVESYFSGQEAIDHYVLSHQSNNPFDLVITDLTLPGDLGGHAIAQTILNQDPMAKIIVSSGYANDPVMAHFKEYGFKGVVAKPYRFADLQQVVHQVLAEP